MNVFNQFTCKKCNKLSSQLLPEITNLSQVIFFKNVCEECEAPIFKSEMRFHHFDYGFNIVKNPFSVFDVGGL